MQRLGVKGIHIAERDTQRAREPKPRGAFVNTWSVEGFCSEGLQPSELGWGTHEKHMPAERPPPRLRLRRRDLPDAAGRRHPGAVLDPDGAGPARLPGDPQRVDLDRRLLHAARGRQGGLPADLPLRLSPLRRRGAVAARDGAARPGSASRTGKSSTSTRSSTASTSWACCSTATPRTPTGTARSSRSRRRGELAPYQNATGLQVTSAVLAGIVWMLENPERGIVEADEMDFRRCLEIQRPYLGPVVGHYTDWTPLDGPRRAVPGGRRRERSVAVQERAGALERLCGVT